MSPHATKPAVRTKPFLIALGIVALLAGMGALGASRALSSSKGPEAAVRALADAVGRRDAKVAMSFIDFDAVYSDAWRSSIRLQTGQDPAPADVAAALARPAAVQAKEKLRLNLLTYLSDPEGAPVDSGAFYAALKTVGQGRLEREGEGATLKLPDEYSLRLARDGEGRWKVVAFRGYEKDFDSYKAQSDKIMIDNGLKPKPVPASPPPAAEEPAP